MEKLTEGLKLFQPWATYIIRGKLTFLIRSFSTKTRERIAIIATDKTDISWLEKVSDKEFMDFGFRTGAIGSIEIKDCIEVKADKVKEELIKLAGKKYWYAYPKHLIPRQSAYNKVYIWVLDKGKEWKEPVRIKSRGHTWAKIDLIDK